MKTFAIILVLGFSSQVCNAFFPTDVETCLLENGFPNTERAIPLVDAIGDPKHANKLKDVPKEKLANAVACMFRKEYINRSLYDMLKILIDMDDLATKDQRLQMVETLTTCNTQAKGNDAELLVCVKAFEPPFDYLLETLHMFGKKPLSPCMGKCGLKIPDLYTLEQHEKNIDELVKRVPRDNMYCAAACRAEDQDNPMQFLYVIFRDNIEDKAPKDKKIEMAETLERCFTEGGYKNEIVPGTLDQTIAKGTKLRVTYQLLTCVKFLESPYIDLVRRKSSKK